MPLSLFIERPFALASSAIRRLSIGAVFIMATFSNFGSALAQTDEIYTRGEDRRDAQDNGDGPFCGPGKVAPFPAGYDSPPDKFPAGDRCAGGLNTRGYYWKCGPSCNAKWMYCWRSPHWTGPPPACDTIVTISGDEPAGGGSSPPSSGQDTVSTGGSGAGSGGGSGSSGGFVCKPPDTLAPKVRWRWYQEHCLAQASPSTDQKHRTDNAIPVTWQCRDQVEVVHFSAKPNPNMAFEPVSIPDLGGKTTWGLRVYAAGNHQQGMVLTASVNVKPGPIPVDDIQIYFVQNVTNHRRLLSIGPPPHNTASPIKAGCAFPLLDTRDGTPPPFYQPTATSGPHRTIQATDTPHFLVHWDYVDGTRTTRFDAFYDFATYLGCTIGNDPERYQTLAKVYWGARMAGNFLPNSNPAVAVPFRFQPDGGVVGTQAEQPFSSQEPPAVMVPPTFNECVQYK